MSIRATVFLALSIAVFLMVALVRVMWSTPESPIGTGIREDPCQVPLPDSAKEALTISALEPPAFREREPDVRGSSFSVASGA